MSSKESIASSTSQLTEKRERPSHAKSPASIEDGVSPQIQFGTVPPIAMRIRDSSVEIQNNLEMLGYNDPLMESEATYEKDIQLNSIIALRMERNNGHLSLSEVNLQLPEVEITRSHIIGSQEQLQANKIL